MAIKGITKEIQRQIYRESNKSVRSLVLKRFKEIKDEMIREFEMHPVTIELDGGPSASNGRSWLKGIEHGISGLGRYLYGDFGAKSRSGAAIQTKNSLGSGGKFRNTSYMSAILFNARRKLERLGRAKL